MDGREEMIMKAISKDLREISNTLKSIDKRLACGQAYIPNYDYIPDVKPLDDCPSRQSSNASSQDNHTL